MMLAWRLGLSAARGEAFGRWPRPKAQATGRDGWNEPVARLARCCGFPWSAELLKGARWQQILRSTRLCRRPLAKARQPMLFWRLQSSPASFPPSFGFFFIWSRILDRARSCLPVTFVTGGHGKIAWQPASKRHADRQRGTPRPLVLEWSLPWGIGPWE